MVYDTGCALTLLFFFFALKSIKKLIKKLQSIVLFFFKPLLTITKDEKKEIKRVIRKKHKPKELDLVYPQIGEYLL
jgi:hypothetical protein